LAEPEREYRFAAPRRWRFDFAWPGLMLAVEVEGLVFGGKSRHTTIGGYAKDCDKYNEASLRGWVVLRFTGAHIRTGEALKMIERGIERLGDRQVSHAGR
jgi:hypothetical protein